MNKVIELYEYLPTFHDDMIKKIIIEEEPLIINIKINVDITIK